MHFIMDVYFLLATDQHGRVALHLEQFVVSWHTGQRLDLSSRQFALVTPGLKG